MIYLNIGTWMPTLVSDQEKQKRHSSAKNIDDSSGSDAKTSDRGAQSSEKPKTAFGPGKVKVDDSSGMQKKQDEKRATDKTKNYFRPGKVKVDDSRGTEKSQTSKDDKSKSYFRPGKVKVDDSRGTENTKKAEPKVVVKTTEVKVTEQKVKAVFDRGYGKRLS
jgi:hypothetical protein